jgi:hypothetical protein
MKKLIINLGCLIILSYSTMFAQNAPVTTIDNINTPGNTAVVPVTVQNFNSISACNLKIQYDNTVALLTNVTLGSGVSPSGGMNFNNTVPGEVLIGWYGSPNVTLPSGGVLFYLHFNKVATGISNIVFIDENQSTTCIYYDQFYNMLNDTPQSTYYIDGSVTFDPLPPAPVTSIPDMEGCIGQSVQFPVTVTGFSFVGSANFIIRYDQNVLSNPVFSNTSNVLPLMANTGMPGIVTVAGQSQTQNGHSLPDNSTFFTLTFTYLGGNCDIYFDHSYNTNCQYGGPTPFFEPLADSPKSAFYLNGSVTCDTEPPVFVAPPSDIFYQCIHLVPAPGLLGWTDNCDGTGSVTGNDLSDGLYCPQMITRTWSYTDACNNNVTHTQIITVNDTIKPVLSTTAVSGDLGCNPTVVAPVFTGSDNCEGAITPLVTTDGATNNGCLYSQTWTANYTDSCGNVATPISITYTWTEDLEAPVLSTTATSGDLGCNPTVVAPVFTGTDNCEGAITPLVTTDGATNNGCLYSQTWTANYTDSCGNAATPVSITYTWTVDTEAPVLSTTAVSGDLGCNPTVVAPVFTGTDNCEGAITPLVTIDGATNNGCLYSQTWTANYTDSCGNAATPVSITYTWTVDTEAPVLTTTAVSGDLGCNPTVVAPIFTGSDNCEGTITPEVTTDGVTNTGCLYSQTWTATYTDACGNAATPVSITYTWTVDTEAPVLTTTAVSGDLGCNPTVVAPIFTGSDNCEGTITPEVTTDGVTNTGCLYSQTWTATYTDACGNAATPVSITYTWTVDTEAPVLSTTAVSGDLGCNPTVVAPIFTGTDNCEGTITPEVTTDGVTNTGCLYSQTWTATYTDACGNAATPVSITYTWTEDLEAPVLSTTATSGDLGCNPTVVAPVFTGTDNCEGAITPLVTTDGATNNGCLYSQTWTATYTDACGNAATPVSITYTWTVDTEAPVLTTTSVSGDLGCNPTVVALFSPEAIIARE